MSSLRRRWVATVSVCALTCVAARATLPPWLQHVVGASTIEVALYRTMQLPAVQALYPRPPKEAQTELARLIAAAPDDAQLYALRAQSDEAALDFEAAETDWKLSVAHSKDAVAAKLPLADFYQQRLMIPQAIATLQEIAVAPAIAPEKYVDPSQQRSWLAFNRELALIADQGLPATQTSAVFQAFVARYPDQPAVYARSLTWQLEQQAWSDAEATIAKYRVAFPKDEVFPIRAQALVEYRRGNVEQALAVYDKSFQPLWPAPLVQSYFSLLGATHRQRAFVAEARTRLAQHPDGPKALNALARIFYYDQQAGRLDRAQQTIDAFRVAREARGGAWTPEDLLTLASLTDATHSYAESARYDFALASTAGVLNSGKPAAQAGLAALVHLLLAAPDQPIAVGAGNLSMYRDIATIDQGPGYWNGILSLWLNGVSPETQYQAETAKAQSYFHRAKAAELLAQLDANFPAAPERAGLHAELVRTYAQYGEAGAVIASGKEFLASFPASPNRVEMAGLMADAYARQKKTADEFALYEALLAELAGKTDGLPLTAGATQIAAEVNPNAVPDESPAASAPAPIAPAAFELASYTTSRAIVPEAVSFARILDRYLVRLVSEGRLPQALTVLRHQLDLNPNDPLLYERLATFLQQNNLSQQQEETYKLAIARFQEPGWYDKLARLYLRERNREAYTALTHQVTDIFAGTDLDTWFRRAGTLNDFNQPGQPAVGPQLALQLNLYAAKRFPHDAVFTRNLLRAYQVRPTANRVAYDDLLRHHWWESDEFRNEFFSSLSRSGKLQGELAQLQTLASAGAQGNPAAVRELAEAGVWTSHFEAATPRMSAIAELYPADATLGDNAVSLNRSLAYLDATPASTKRAVAIEQRLLTANPDDPNRLATLGDLYAEATSTGGEDLASATPYWHRIPALHAGTPAGYLTAATILWDYFQFDEALAELTAARTKFHEPALYGYEAGAIEENRRDLPAAIREYTAVATDGPGNGAFVASLHAAVGAYLKPPSDAADSNLRATVQTLFNASAARSRLLQLATRPATSALVDKASAQAVAAAAMPATLMLRADVLTAQHRQAELAPLLDEALARAKTQEEAAAIGELARGRSTANDEAHLEEVDVTLGSTQRVEKKYAPGGALALTAVYEHALVRQAALTSDAVERIQLEYALASSMEDRKEVAGATKTMDVVYRENPRLLGVVRATTDFYARTNQPPRAIGTLLEAAKVASPELARSFTLEAAQKANDSGDPKQARALAEGLLVQTPYDATVLGTIAASYGRANDDTGLKQFYVAQLAVVTTAALTPEARKSETALLRRGLIPALTRLKDYPGAVDQYIALLSAYPEDAATAQEAALYALRYGRRTQLVDFLVTTVKQSPKDSRFAILLAQVDATFEDMPGALAAYSQAIAIRKDRLDLYTARVDLELRLGQFEPAAEDFNRLYLLSYKDPSWMVKLAELRARQQRPADAVQALETAYITGKPAEARNSFAVADQLTKWNLTGEARTFAEQGVSLAGKNLLTATNNAGSATSYARIMARAGKPDEAIATLLKARHDVDANLTFPAELAAQLAAAGVSANDIAQHRNDYLETHRKGAHTQVDQAVVAIGQVVTTYYTPEQKAAYAQALAKLHAADADIALAAATPAGLVEVEAEWRKQLLLTAPLPQDSAAYVALERRRLYFSELGNTLELYATRLQPRERPGVLREAAQAYRDAGDEANEMRVTRPLVLAEDDGLRDRFFDLLLRHDRAALTALAASRNEKLADAAADYAVAHATQAHALSAIAQRGRALPAVWRPATASLALTYFADAKAPTATAVNFTESLASDATIAQRLALHADTARQFTGDNWFYYASRFGLFLQAVPKAATLPDAEDFLAAELERAPSSPAAYLHLARAYVEANNPEAAIAEYKHALEVAPNNPAVHDEFAVTLYRGGKRDEAVAQWREALEILVKRQSGEEFFAAFKAAVAHLGERKLTATLKPELESILRPYLARNGNYRSDELLAAIYKASATPAEGTAFVLQAAGFADNPNNLLEDFLQGGLRNAAWMTPELREAVLVRQVELARNMPTGQPESGALQVSLRGSILIDFYLDRNEPAKAQAVLNTMPSTTEFDQIHRVVLAVRTGHLQPLLDAWRDQPETMPKSSEFESILNRLRMPTAKYKPDAVAIRPLQEFVFEHKQLTHTLISTDFVALAQARLDTGDLAGALEILRRLALQPASTASSGPVYPATDSDPAADGETSVTYRVSASDVQDDPYANIDAAARLLETAHHPAEAVSFLATLVQSAPWTASYRLRLVEAEMKSGDAAKAADGLAKIANDPAAPYALRTQAALDMRGLTPAPTVQFGSAELNLLASTSQTATAARQPYFVAARVAVAASAARPDRIALLREAIAIELSGAETNEARLDLLTTMTPADNASATLGLYNTIASASSSFNSRTEEDSAAVSDEPAANWEDASPNLAAFPFAFAHPLDRPAQIRLAVLLASAYQRDGNAAQSVLFDRLAVNLDAQNPKPDAVVVKRLADYMAQLELERKNARRRPSIHRDLDQAVQVRPHLTLADQARAEAP